MQVVARDVLQHVGCTGVDRDLVADGIAERLLAFAVDQNAVEFVAGGQRPLDHQIALGDEPAGHLAARQLSLLAKGVVPESLEHEDPGVFMIDDLDAGHPARLSSPAMQAIVIFESLTGNTAKAGRAIADQLTEAGIPTVASPINQIDLQALSAADLVIVGSWVDGIFIAGQKPGREGRLKKMPVIDGKQAAVYCTYALKDGKTLQKLSAIVEERGGDVIGGYAIRRDRLERDTNSFVDRLLGALSTTAS